jgi:hypothetical protein
MCVSTLHDQNVLSSFLKHFHFVDLQGLKMCPFKQQPCVDLQIYTCQHYLCDKKWSDGCVFNNILNPQNVFHSCTISISKTSEKYILKIVKNSEKQQKQ